MAEKDSPQEQNPEPFDLFGEETLGERLHRLRRRKKMTAAAVARTAREMGVRVSGSAISRYERDLRDPSTAILKALARIYGTDPNYLLDFQASIRYFTQSLFDQHEQAAQRGSKRPKLTAQTRRSA